MLGSALCVLKEKRVSSVGYKLGKSWMWQAELFIAHLLASQSLCRTWKKLDLGSLNCPFFKIVLALHIYKFFFSPCQLFSPPTPAHKNLARNRAFEWLSTEMVWNPDWLLGLASDAHVPGHVQSGVICKDSVHGNIVSYSSSFKCCCARKPLLLACMELIWDVGTWQIRHILITRSLMSACSFNFILSKNGTNGELAGKWPILGAHKSSLWSTILIATCLLFQDLKWLPNVQPSASPVAVPSLVFPPGTETGTGLCTSTAQSVPLSALPSADQNIVKQTVKRRIALGAWLT